MNLITLKNIALLVLLSGCANKNQPNTEIEDLLKETKETISENLSVDDYTQDYNLDGVPDVYYESYADSYIQFSDRNFDGIADEQYEFDASTNFLLNGRLDNDFNGTFETQEVIFEGVIQFEFIDSNDDKLIDIASTYKNGVLNNIEQYIHGTKGTANQIKVYEFKFGIPLSNKLQITKLNAKEFHQNKVEKIQIQTLK